MARNRSDPDGPPHGDGRRERWREHREVRRRELVRGTVDAVRRRGADVGMDDIAAETGVAKQVFYRYFADKADLHLAVGRAVARWVVGEVTRVLERHDDPHAMLAAAIARYLELVESEPELYRFVVHLSPSGHTRAGDPVSDYSTVLGLHVSRLVGDRLRAAGRDAGAAEPWGFALVGSVRSAADRWLTQPTMTRAALCEYLTAFAWTGLSAAASVAPGERPGLRSVGDTAS